jgi:hypothetical protein
MFLDNDERIIIMEDDYYFPFSLDDIKKLRDAGIKTVMIPHILNFDSSNKDGFLSKLSVFLSQELKVLVPFCYSDRKYTMLDWINLSRDLLDFRLTVLDDWLGSELRKSVQLIYAVPEGGEFLWDAMQTGNYPISDEELFRFIVYHQQFLGQEHKEIYLSLHNFLGDSKNWNNTHLPFLYEKLRSEFPNAPLYSFQYAHFSCGGTPTPIDMQYKVKRYTEDYGVKFFVGSDYCEGLTKNFDYAMKQKAYGFVTSPMHSENPIKHEHVEDWMVDTLRETNKRINDYYSI